jgi:hypothetical protein
VEWLTPARWRETPMALPQPPPPGQPAYPVRLSIDYPNRSLNRLTTAFRIFVAIPIAIVLQSVSGQVYYFATRPRASVGAYTGPQYVAVAGAGGLLFLGPLLMILFRKKYPRWWFDWNVELQRFTNRVLLYILLMDDRYPSTDEQQSLHLDYEYPDARGELNRFLPLVKWLLVIPHFIVLAFLWIAVVVVVFIAWLAILFTGRYPRGLFNFVEGVVRWGQRVVGYAFVLATDRYPPFSLAL